MENDVKWGISLCETPDDYKEGDIERIKEANIGWVRLHFSWRHIEKEKGVFDFSFYDALVDKIKGQNLKIVAAVGCGYTDMLPDWIAEENEKCLNLLSYLPQISRFVNEVVNRFKEKIQIWQAENEINQTSFHVTTGWRQKSWMLNPVGELSVLVGIISCIKACQPKAKVLINLECDNPNWYPFIKLCTKKKLPFDIIGIDFYPCYSPAFSSSDPIFSCPDRILKMVEVIKKASRLKKEIIVAETGYPAPKKAYSDENQEAYIHQACQAVLTTDAQGVFIWSLSDQHFKKPEFPEYYFGLYNYDRTPKPALATYKEEIARLHQTVIVSIKGLLFKEQKAWVEVYINGNLAGKSNLDGMFISRNLSPGKYKIKVKGFFPWQRRSKQIELTQGNPQYTRCLI